MEYTLINFNNEKYSVLEQVLINRGFQPKEIYHYFNLTKADVLFPQQLKNIDKAVALLAKQLLNKDSKIFIQVDPDYDGFASAACLINYIHKTIPSAVSKITYDFHKGKEHGIDMSLIPEGTTLVIAPDSSSGDYEIHEKLAKENIEVLVIDHHQANYESEYACVVNNQLCDYPNKTLSGAGVVYKLCQRLDDLMNVSYSDTLLDLVATALIGDMMDIRNSETRFLIQEGLAHINNPFIKGMIEKNSYSIGEEITPMGIAFYVVPFVNAVTRVGTQEEKRLLFDSMLEWKAYNLVPSTKRGCKGQQETLVEQAIRTCTNIKSRQAKLQDSGVEAIEELIKSQNLLANKLLIIKLRQDEVDPNIRGLIANKLMAKYQRPVAILSETEYEGEKAWMGSARGYEKSKLKNFKGFCGNSGFVFLAQGHPNAFGLGIYDKDFDNFIAYSNNTLKDMDFSPSYKVDFIYSIDNINPQDILDLGNYKYLWGQNMDEPLLALERIKVSKDMVTLMSKEKNPTLKIQLPNGISCIKFKSSEEEYESLLSSGYVMINIVGRAEVNKYFDNVTPQILINDYEIVGIQEFWF